MQPTNFKLFCKLRLEAQGLIEPCWDNAAEVAQAFGVMQGQDLHTVERNFELRARNPQDWRELVRGYPMRNTLFVAHRNDMGWITELCAKRRAKDPDLSFLLEDLAAPVTREALKALVARRCPDVALWHVIRILAESNQAYYQGYVGDSPVFGAMELPGLEQVFNGDKVAATAELMSRYFRTHGPATLDDFAWWSKLPKRLIKHAVDGMHEDIISLEDLEGIASSHGLDGGPHFVSRHIQLPSLRGRVHLLGAFDEYVLGYQNRLFCMTQAMHEVMVPGNRGVFLRPVIVDGQVKGSWTKAGVIDRGLSQSARAEAEQQLERINALH